VPGREVFRLLMEFMIVILSCLVLLTKMIQSVKCSAACSFPRYNVVPYLCFQIYNKLIEKRQEIGDASVFEMLTCKLFV
jgi:hypothetical protein